MGEEKCRLCDGCGDILEDSVESNVVKSDAQNFDGVCFTV